MDICDSSKFERKNYPHYLEIENVKKKLSKQIFSILSVTLKRVNCAKTKLATKQQKIDIKANNALFYKH